MSKFTAVCVSGYYGTVFEVLNNAQVPMADRIAKIFLIKDGEGRIMCSVSEWGFCACAARVAQGFTSAAQLLSTEDKIALCKFLVSTWSDNAHYSGYNAQECYLLLGYSQWEGYDDVSWKHVLDKAPKLVQVVDQYTKKSEQQEYKRQMRLLRISESGDFQ